ncbi:MAG: hypothetical protein IPJ71_15665 [Bdellovibrionales bacterium]|nr:hypothetical protein [Bdellovibrionales bacterium]
MADWRGFRFSIKVWSPKEFRMNPKIAYEYRSYEIEDIYFGTNNPQDVDLRDFAFVKLKEPVGRTIGKSDLNGGNLGEKVMNSNNLIQPFQFRKLGSKKTGKKAHMGGFHGDKDNLSI